MPIMFNSKTNSHYIISPKHPIALYIPTYRVQCSQLHYRHSTHTHTQTHTCTNPIVLFKAADLSSVYIHVYKCIDSEWINFKASVTTFFAFLPFIYIYI